MIKGEPEIGEELMLSYNNNVSATYAGLDTVTFHDEELASDEAIRVALISKCDIPDPDTINLDSIFWQQKKSMLD